MRDRVSRALFSWAAVTVAMSVFAFGCSSTTADSGSIAGTYNLLTINGQNPPAYVGAGQGDSLFISAGSVTLTTTTYIFHADGSLHVNGTPTAFAEGDTGTYTRTGSALTLVSNQSDAGTTSATITGNSITVPHVSIGNSGNNDLTLVFTKG